MKMLIVSLILFSFAFTGVNGQKLKFKNIYPLVVSDDYESAEPLLVEFLEIEPDHPSANLMMMIVADEYLNDGELVLKYADLSKKLVNEKDIKKNEDYYKYYERRDFRSGKYTVKLSDIELDIEKRVEKYQ